MSTFQITAALAPSVSVAATIGGTIASAGSLMRVGLASGDGGLPALDMAMAAISSISPASGLGAQIAQVYAMMIPSLAQQDDATQVMAFLLAFVAATSCATKSETASVIDEIAEIATQTLEESFSLMKMPLRRPDNFQMSALLAQIASGRTSNGLN